MKDLLGSRSPLGFLGSLLLVLPWRRGDLGCLDETAVWACFVSPAFLARYSNLKSVAKTGLAQARMIVTLPCLQLR